MSTILQLPVTSNLEAYSFSINLEGTYYVLGFNWNDRLGLWIMDVAASDSTPLVSGIPLQTGVFNLLTRFRYIQGLPPGAFLAYDTSGNNADAGRQDLGNNVQLLYRQAVG